MKNIFTILVFSISIACSNDYNDYIKRETQLNSKEYNLFKIKLENRYLNNKIKVKEFKQISDNLDSLFLEISSNLEQENYNKINENLIELKEYLRSVYFFEYSNEIRNITLPNRITPWINKGISNVELFRLDMIASKNKLLQQLYYSIGENELKFNKTMVIVVDNNNTVKLGETYEANIFLAGLDSTKLPSIKSTGFLEYNEDILQSNYREKFMDLKLENGIGVFRFKPDEIGKKVFIGTYNVFGSDGETIEYLFYKEVEVVK